MDHDNGDEEAVSQAMSQLLTIASDLGLYGVMVMSPICSGCGSLHAWSVMANTTPGPGADDGEMKNLIAGLLEHQASRIREMPVEGTWIAKGRKH